MSDSSPHLQALPLDPETKALPPLPPQQQQLPHQLALGEPTPELQTPPPLPPHPQTPDLQTHAHLVGPGATPGSVGSNNGNNGVTGPTTATILTPGANPDSTFTIPASRAPLALPQDLPENLISKPVATLEALTNNPLALRGLADSLAYSPSPVAASLSATTSATAASSAGSSEPASPSPSPSPSASSASPSPASPLHAATPIPAAYSSASLDALISQQTTAAHSNATMAHNLATKIRTVLPPRREMAGRALASAQAVERNWLDVEADMYKALQPYTMDSLHARMARAMTEAEQVSDSLADSFLHPQPAGSSSGQGAASAGDKSSSHGEAGGGNEESNSGDDVAEFIQNYRKERKTYYMRREILERWREERVARTY